MEGLQLSERKLPQHPPAGLLLRLPEQGPRHVRPYTWRDRGFAQHGSGPQAGVGDARAQTLGEETRAVTEKGGGPEEAAVSGSWGGTGPERSRLGFGGVWWRGR